MGSLVRLLVSYMPLAPGPPGEVQACLTHCNLPPGAVFRTAHCKRCATSMPKAPQPKTLETQPIALAWQPESRRHFAVGCVDGRVEIHSTKQAQPLARMYHGDRGAASAVAWSDGLCAGFGDGAVCCWDTEGGAKAWKAKGRGAKVTAMLSTRNMIAVGDDSGRITLRDARMSGDRSPSISTQPHADYVSGLCAIRDEILVSAGADGVLAAMDLRKSLKSIGETDPSEDELLSCCVTPHSVIAGTATGPLLVWSRKDLDKEPAVVASEHDSVEALVAVQDVVLTGTGDGVVRAYEEGDDASLTAIGGVGAHGGFPVEVLAKTSGDELVASLSHDNAVRFFDATSASRIKQMLAEASGSSDDDSDDGAKPKKKAKKEAFFDGL